MAVAIMGGLIVATALTLLFLRRLYAACSGCRPRANGARGSAGPAPAGGQSLSDAERC